MAQIVSGWSPKAMIILKWLAFLAVALLVLKGRYNWAPETRQVALRSYLSSAYLLCFTLPTLYYILTLYIRKKAIIRGCVGAIAVLFTLPYRWLNLDQFYYNALKPYTYPLPNSMQNTANWMPRGGLLKIIKELPRLGGMPNEIFFFGLLILLGVAVALLWFWRVRSHSEARSRTPIKTAIGWFGLFLLLLLQAWLHLSMRSPYVYVPHFEKPQSEDYWYVQYLFPEGKGAVNADYLAFHRPMDDWFLGAPLSVNPNSAPIMIRRAFPHYVGAQLSYFFSPYYVYLAMNIALWFLVCASIYRLAALLWSRRAAAYAAAIAATGPGFIMFLAQPMSYVAGYAVMMLLFALLEESLISKQNRNITDFLGFGCALGLASLVYSIFPIYVGLALYVLIRRVPWSHVARFAVGLGLAGAIYYGFLKLQTNILGFSLDTMHTGYLESSWRHVFSSTLFHAHLGPLYRMSIIALRTYFGGIVNAFFIIPLLVALVGLLFIRERSRLLLIAAMAVPSLLAIVFLQFGEVKWGLDENGIELYLASLPRFVFIAYPAVYCLMALSLDAFHEHLLKWSVRKPFVYAANIGPWLILAFCFYLSNVDVWNYPQLYYLFFYPSCGIM
jgi:hypothetical protein